MIAFCPACLFYNQPLPGHIVGAGSGAGMSPGQLEAARDLMQLESERRDEEERRVDQEYRFDYEPQFHAWCGRFTPDPNQVAEVLDRLMRGDESYLLELQEKGLDFVIDAPNGKVRPVYALCEQKNRNGRCGEFKARERADSQ